MLSEPLEPSAQRLSRRINACAALLLGLAMVLRGLGHERLWNLGPLPRPWALLGGSLLSVALLTHGRTRASLGAVVLALGAAGLLDLLLGQPLAALLGGTLLWPPVGLGLVLLGASLCLTRAPFAEGCAVYALTVSSLPLVDLTYRGALPLHTEVTHQHSPYMALVLIALAMSTLTGQSEFGFVARARDQSLVDVLLRRALPVTMLALFSLGWLALALERFGVATGTLPHMLLASVLAAGAAFAIISASRHLARLDGVREQAFERALSQQRFFQAVIDHVPLMITVKDAKTRRYTLINRAAGQELGSPDAVGHTTLELRPEAAGWSAELDERTVVSRETFDVDAVPIERDGERRFMRIRKVPLLDARGQVASIVNVAEDVTRKEQDALVLRSALENVERANQALAESTRALDDLIDSLPSAAFAFEVETGRFTRMNRWALAMAGGIGLERLLGSTLAQLLPAELAERFSIAARSADTGREATLEYELPGPDGTHFFRSRLVPLGRGFGGAVQVLGTTEELTAEHRNAEALRKARDEAESTRRELLEQEAFLTTVLDNLAVGVIVADHDLRFVMANRRACEVMGVERSDLVGHRPSEVLAPDLARGTEGRLLAMDPTNEVVEDDFERIEGSGTRVYHTRKVVIRDASGAPRYYVATAEDVSAARAAAAELRTAKERAETANRELEAFSYSVSHDLRAPLRAIDGFSLAVLEDCAGQLDDTARSHLHRVRAAAQRMAQLIEDMLRLARVSRLEVETEHVDLSALSRAVLDELRAGSPRAVRLEVDDGITCEGDARMLRILLENLLDNAWKFTAKGDLTHIEVRGHVEGKDQVLEIRDNGAGFDMAYAGKLFEPFRRLHAPADYPGTGVGLVTVQRVVQRHGGRVWAEAELGRGARFYVALPRAG